MKEPSDIKISAADRPERTLNPIFWKPSGALSVTVLAALLGIIGGLATALVGVESFKTLSEITIKYSEVSEKDRPSKTFSGHSRWIYSVAISPDGQTIASGSYDKSIKVWNLHTDQLLHTLRGHSDAVESVAISSDGRRLASGSWDNRIKLWNLETGELIHTLSGHSDDVKAIAIAPDDRLLASASWDKTVKIWNLHTGEAIRTLRNSDSVRAVAFSPDGETLASGSEDGKITIWQVSAGHLKMLLAAHHKAVNSLAFSPDGQTLASGSEDKTIALWNLQTGQLKITLAGHKKAVLSVAISPNGQTLASGSSDGTIKLWNLGSGCRNANCLAPTRTIAAHAKSVWSLTFSPDGRSLASGSGDETIEIWPISSSPEPQPRTTPSLRPSSSPPQITDPAYLAALNEKLYHQINQRWQESPTFEENLVYRVTVNSAGAIARYEPLDRLSADLVRETPLPNWLNSSSADSSHTARGGVDEAAVADFQVVFTPTGVLEVSPWEGWRK